MHHNSNAPPSYVEPANIIKIAGLGVSIAAHHNVDVEENRFLAAYYAAQYIPVAQENGIPLVLSSGALNALSDNPQIGSLPHVSGFVGNMLAESFLKIAPGVSVFFLYVFIPANVLPKLPAKTKAKVAKQAAFLQSIASFLKVSFPDLKKKIATAIIKKTGKSPEKNLFEILQEYKQKAQNAPQNNPQNNGGVIPTGGGGGKKPPGVGIATTVAVALIGFAGSALPELIKLWEKVFKKKHDKELDSAKMEQGDFDGLFDLDKSIKDLEMSDLANASEYLETMSSNTATTNISDSNERNPTNKDSNTIMYALMAVGAYMLLK